MSVLAEDVAFAAVGPDGREAHWGGMSPAAHRRAVRAEANRKYNETGDVRYLQAAGLAPQDVMPEEFSEVKATLALLDDLQKAPPGPPPRPHLVWYEPTHRWRNPKGVEGETPYKWVRAGAEIDKVDWQAPVLRTVKGKERRETLNEQPIPPAWTDVAVNSDPKGKLQAVGLDVKGQIVRVYHPDFVAAREDAKYKRQREFAGRMPDLRRAIKRDFAERDEAKVLHVIDQTGFRVGDEEGKDSRGVATLQVQDVQVRGNTVTFDFMGKHGVRNVRRVRSKALAEYVQRAKAEQRPGDMLFNVTAGQVRRYMNQVGFMGFSPKDFRTYHANQLAAKVIKEYDPPETSRQFSSLRNKVAEQVSAWLHNTPGVALRSYIDPRVFRSWERAISKDNDWRARWQPEWDLAVTEENGVPVFLPYWDEEDAVEPKRQYR